jgi:hypothetical protein
MVPKIRVYALDSFSCTHHILYIMKKRIAIVFVYCLLGAYCIADSAETQPSLENYLRYFAGIEMLATDKTGNRRLQAAQYRRLCVVTGISGAMAKDFALGYKNDPAGWQKFLSAVLDVLQKKE